jgi:uncharacterized protein YndB with AHSA1/START domain
VKRFLSVIVLCGLSFPIASRVIAGSITPGNTPSSAPKISVHTTPGSDAGELWVGKKKTEHSINLSVTVEAPIWEVFQLWTTPEGLSKFMSPGANVDPKVGGRYETLFDPVNDPHGEKRGCGGCRILRFETDKSLAFEWNTPVPSLNSRPLPTWVEVELNSPPGAPGKTEVKLAHYGFPPGAQWDQMYAIFKDKLWPLVLKRLSDYCQSHQPFDWSSPH